MKKLIEYTKILRSKNAGPLFITFDLIFNSLFTSEVAYFYKLINLLLFKIFLSCSFFFLPFNNGFFIVCKLKAITLNL